MFCYQCQETAKGTGCTLKGVCGKTSEVANLQDLLLFVVRGIAVYNQKLRWEKRPSDEADRFIFDALFITITNANFDKAAIIHKIKEGLTLKHKLSQEVTIENAPDECTWNGSEEEFEEKENPPLVDWNTTCNFNNEVKNDVLNFKYRYKKTSDTNYNNWVDIPTSLIPNTKKNYYIDYTKGEVGLSATVIGDFDIEDTYTFQFQLKDKLNDLSFTAILVNGIPLIALRKGKVGINCVPKSDGTNGLYVNNAELNIINAESVKSPTLLNGWTKYGGDYDTAGYYKDKDRVFLQGLIKGGTVGAVAFTLPVGYRPAKRKIFVVNANNTFGRVDVLSNGNVYIDAMCSNSYVSLENINFRI